MLINIVLVAAVLLALLGARGGRWTYLVMAGGGGIAAIAAYYS